MQDSLEHPDLVKFLPIETCTFFQMQVNISKFPGAPIFFPNLMLSQQMKCERMHKNITTTLPVVVKRPRGDWALRSEDCKNRAIDKPIRTHRFFRNHSGVHRNHSDAGARLEVAEQLDLVHLVSASQISPLKN
jgi:hypothetical protein